MRKNGPGNPFLAGGSFFSHQQAVDFLFFFFYSLYDLQAIDYYYLLVNFLFNLFEHFSYDVIEINLLFIHMLMCFS